MAVSNSAAAEFDSYAEGYDAGMENPLKRLLGSDPAQYLRVKALWMMQDLRRRPVASTGGERPRLLEYGCGHGLFLKVIADEGFSGTLTGCDISREMLHQAAHTWQGQQGPEFFLLQGDDTASHACQSDIVVVCAVMHHVAPPERAAVYRQVHQFLKPGGRLYVFEHNPLNPVTTFVVKRTPIDRNAILLRAGEVVQGLDQAGFRGVGVQYQMFFPPRLRWLLGLEDLLRWLPLGGQYVVWGDKS